MPKFNILYPNWPTVNHKLPLLQSIHVMKAFSYNVRNFNASDFQKNTIRYFDVVMTIIHTAHFRNTTWEIIFEELAVLKV